MPSELIDLTPDRIAGLSDDALLHAQRDAATERRRIDAVAASIAAEIARRCAPDRGADGLAVRERARDAVALVARISGASRRESGQLVQIGAELAAPSPWLRPVTDAVRSGRVGVAAADAIRVGLGAPTAEVTVEQLAAAAVALVDAADDIGLDRLAARARAERDALDAAGIAERAARRYARRSFRIWQADDGMLRFAGATDPEHGAELRAFFDAITAPRRDPRFVPTDAADPASPDHGVLDDRTWEQLQHDALLAAIRIAGTSTKLLPTRPAVRVHITATELANATGAGRIEGSPDAIPLPAVQRLICDTGVLPIIVDDAGRDVLALGRTRRLFSPAQRAALAARDGGCRYPGCDRPPSWCEAHHAIPWALDGPTDLANGILLCTHHHLAVHNNGLTIRPGGPEGFQLHDPRQMRGDPPVPIPMPPQWRITQQR